MTNQEQENKLRLADAAIRLGLPVKQIKYVPFGGGIEPYHRNDKIEFSPEDYVVFFGTIQAYKYLYKATSWGPLGWADFDSLKCHVYYDYFGKYLLDPSYRMFPIREILRRQEEIFHDCESLFIRPDDNEKSFDGQVVTKDALPSWLDYICRYNDLHSVCIISDIKEIKKEWRFVVKDNKVVTGSQYKSAGEIAVFPVCDNDAILFTEKMLEETSWKPHPIFCVDVALTNEGYRLMEIGSINVCGFYACDMKKLIQAVVEVVNEEQR